MSVAKDNLKITEQELKALEKENSTEDLPEKINK